MESEQNTKVDREPTREEKILMCADNALRSNNWRALFQLAEFFTKRAEMAKILSEILGDKPLSL